MSLAGYLHSVFIGGVSMFFVMILLQSFFGSGNYSIVGPYMGEVWPARLRGSGMGLVYGVGNLGKFIGPAGLALIAGSSNYRRAEGDARRADPGVQLFRLLVCAGRRRVLVHRLRDARPLDRGDRCRAFRARGIIRKGPSRSHFPLVRTSLSALPSNPRRWRGMDQAAAAKQWVGVCAPHRRGWHEPLPSR